MAEPETNALPDAPPAPKKGQLLSRVGALIKKRNLMSPQAFESLSTLFGFTAISLLALAAIAGCAAWYFSAKTTGLKETALKQYEDASKIAIASANAQAAESAEKAAKANEAVARLEQEAAAARLELEKLKNSLAWRAISEQQAGDFLKAVAAFPKARIEFNYVPNDPEAARFAILLSEVLRKAGYDVPDRLEKMRSVLPAGGSPTGVEIVVADENNVAAAYLQKSLRTLGIAAAGRLAPKQTEPIVLNIGRNVR